MKKDNLVEIYLQNYAAGEKWKLIRGNAGNISQVVVIPAYAEKETLFLTLASLSKNHPSSVEDSFVLCVVNNKDDSPADVIANNRQTLDGLNALVQKKAITNFRKDPALYESLTVLSDSGMKLGYIDASSDGCQIPEKNGGVGTARKIGMDCALRLLREKSDGQGVIISLDADTLVQENYLSVIKSFFRSGSRTAIVAYEHPLPFDAIQKAAICCYEIFLRYWVLGLRYAKSPWAFHSIGSTISVSTQAYLDVRGMNRKAAGEDFYFLNKLAKVGKIDYIKETCVFPSARSSSRVPFGTGKRVERFLGGNHDEEYCLYDPRIFSILAAWLELIEVSYSRSAEEVMTKAGQIHPALRNFLHSVNFSHAWSKINAVSKKKEALVKHFHVWFDGFKTLKMVHYLTRESLPRVNMFAALGLLLSMSGMSRFDLSEKQKMLPLGEQINILNYLRTVT